MLIPKISNYFSSNAFMRHNAVFFVGSLAIAALNYLYYPVIGRLVSIEDFGEIQAVISLFTQLGILLTAFGYVVTNIVNNSDKASQEAELMLNLEKITLALSLAIFVLISATSFFVKESLQFESVIPLLLLGLLVILNVPSTSRSFYLQGLRRMGELSISGILFAAGKLAISVVLILIGSDVIAVMMGYIISQSITLIYLRIKTYPSYPSLRRSLTFRLARQDRRLLRQELIYGLATLILLSGVTALYTSDAVLVRLFVSQEDAGAYSGVSAIARIVYFVTASVAGVLLATVKMKNSKTENLNLLKRSIILVTLIGGGTAALFSLMPSVTMALLLGNKYTIFADLLPLTALFMLLSAYNNLFVCYQIALRRFTAIYIIIIGILAFSIMLIFWQETLEGIVTAYVAANALVAMLLLLQIMRGKKYV